MSNKDLIAKAVAWDYEAAGYSETADLARDLASALEATEAKLVEHADEPHRYICPQVAQAAAKAAESTTDIELAVDRMHSIINRYAGVKVASAANRFAFESTALTQDAYRETVNHLDRTAELIWQEVRPALRRMLGITDDNKQGPA